MKGFPILFALVVVAAASGCATADTNGTEQARREEPTYVTGSNIARHQQAGEVSVMSQQGYETARSLPPSMPQTPGGSH